MASSLHKVLPRNMDGQGLLRDVAAAVTEQVCTLWMSPMGCPLARDNTSAAASWLEAEYDGSDA